MTMGLIDGLQATAARTKLRGDCVLLDREMTVCKETHGAKIYDAMQSRNNGREAALPGLEASFVATSEDLRELMAKKIAIDEEIDKLEDMEQRTVGEKAQLAKLKAQMAFYSREIKIRKGIFGIQIFDELGLMTCESSPDFQGEDDTGGGAVLGDALRDAVDAMDDLARQKEEKILEIQKMRG